MSAARAVALALVAAALWAAPASAFEKGSWTSAADLSVLGFHSSAPQVTVAPDGTMIAVWGRSDGGNSVIQAATRAPGGALSDPVTLSDPARTAMFPRIAIAADGTATAVWSIADGNDVVIEASTRPPGGSFGAAVTVGAGQFLAAPQVGVALDGTTTVAWSSAAGPPGSPRIARAATRPAGGVFGAPVELSVAGQDASSPELAVAADGTTTAVWGRSNGTNQIAQAATRPPGGAFGAPADLSAPGAHAQLADLALAPDGTITAVWTRGSVVQATTRPPGDDFSAPVDISRAGETTQEPRVAVAGDGATTIAWRASNADNDTNIQAATRPSGGAFAAPVDLLAPVPHGELPDPPAFVYSPRVGAAADGTTTVLWTHPDGPHNRMRASTRLPGGDFGAPIYLSAPGLNAFDPQVGMAANGFATVVWSLSDGVSRNKVQAAFTADAPIGRGALTIEGTPALGSTLTCDGGRWIDAATVETHWLRGAAEVATGPAYTVADADQGADLMCRGTATNTYGSTSRSSLPLSIAAAPPGPPLPAPLLPASAPAPGAPIAPPADLTAPRVAIFTKQRLTRREFLRGVSLRVSTDETATVVAELRGRASRSRTTGPFTRPLGSRKLFGVTRRAISVKIKPRASAVGRARSFSVRLRLIVTDALGNKRITGKTIRIAG